MQPSTPPVVWIVDDSPVEAASAARALSPHFAVSTLEDGSAAIAKLAESEPPDALVLDWYMPGMSGIETCEFLRANPATAGLPILILTAGQSDLVDALAAGADDYVVKPFGAPELVARVGALVRANRLRTRAENAERELSTLLVREREARAAAEAANRSKDEFLATLSHELRTPLHAILGWASLMRSETLDPDGARRAAETIERNARLQATLIDDLLDVSRIISGKLELAQIPTDLTGAVGAAVESVRPTATAKNVQLAVYMPSDFVWVSGDGPRLQQVLWNLLSNAIKFTPRDGRVAVRLEATEGLAKITVTDTGQGIASEFLPYVFERFRQADGTSTRSNGGLGLGLAIVRHIVEQHGGAVAVASPGVGAGATFTVTLPRIEAQPQRAVSRPERENDRALEGVEVLAVDDEDDAQQLMATILGAAGAHVVTASSVDEALSIVAQRAPDVIISDVAMPGRSGHDLIREVRRTATERGSWIPAIAVTAHAHERERWECLAAGFQVHMSKPLSASELVWNIVNLVRRHAPRPA